MGNSLHPSLTDKRAFYQQPDIVADYDRQRFGSRSGAWVNERELSLIEGLLPLSGRVLDLGCGTGRLSRRLESRGYQVVALDSSPGMLASVQSAGIPTVLGDGFSLPFDDGTFAAVVALRVAFHYANVGDLLSAAGRVLKPGGRFVFDTYRWTPRALLAIDPTRWGGKLFIHPPERVRSLAQAAGLRVAAANASFLFSPYIYRLMPYPMVEALAHVESVVPESIKARIFWAVERET